ncbi:MAG: type II secretion system major pseudopilin GspG [Paraburkholderia sp.]|uniref:type II secretion system major pseudopilin GspG n=1 Tax=Paraburkholderia sp. TaxID=1926495 RepID=UPI003C462CD6
MGNNHRTKITSLFRLGQRRFTLSEILVVIASLAILAGLIVSKVVSSPDEVKRVAAKQDIGTIMQALELYRRHHGRYPTQEPGLRALIEKPDAATAPNIRKGGDYLERLPNDPWGNAYQYRNPGVHGEIDVFSYGADGRQGGEGSDTDIGSWD